MLKAGYCCLCKQEVQVNEATFIKVSSMGFYEEKMCHLKCWKIVSREIDKGLCNYKSKFKRGSKFVRQT